MEWKVIAKVQAWCAFQIERGRERMQLQGTYGDHTSSNTCIQVEIVPENINHNYVITFQLLQQWKVQYIRQAQSIRWFKSL